MKVYPLSPEGDCLTLEHLWAILRETKDVKRCVVDTITGPVVRTMFETNVWYRRQGVPVWADKVTGTLYRKDGTCMTSGTRRIKQWL